MASYDFSFKNADIKNWFNGKAGSTCPSSEFKYLHEHPLVKPNFINDLEKIIYDAGVHAKTGNISGKPINRLVSLAGDFTRTLSDFVETKSDESAVACLEVMRELYKVCNFILSLK